MNYTKRLLKFVTAHNGMFETRDIATIWKRNYMDIRLAANALHRDDLIKFGPCYKLSLTENTNVA